MLKNYFIIALRNLQRYRLYTVINVMGITLGFSAAVVIYIVLSAETKFDAFHSNTSNTYRIVHHNHTAEGTQYWNTTAYPLAEALQQEYPQATITQAVGPVSAIITVQEETKKKRFTEDKVLYADKQFLSVFDFKEAYPHQEPWLAGSPATAFDHPNAVVLTQTAANRYFSNAHKPQELLGNTIQLNEKETLVVTGVIEDLPPNTSLSFDLLISYQFFKAHNEDQAKNWSGNHQGTTFVVLPEQVKQKDFERALASVEHEYLNESDQKRIEWVLQPLTHIHTDTLYGSSPGSYVISQDILRGLMILAVFLVLIACVNYINLATAQSLKRNREVGVRKVLGASRKQLFFQYMTETCLISLVAGVLSLYVAYWVIKLVNREITFTQFNFTIDSDFILFGMALLLVITFISGGYPALVLSRLAPVQVFNNKSTTAKSKISVRKLLIVFQFGTVQLLVAGTIVVASQMHYFRNKDLGYDKDTVLNVPFPNTDINKQEVFRQRLMQRPEIEQVSFSSGAPTPYGRQYGTSFRLSHEPEKMMREAEMKMIDPEYRSVYGLKMIAGSWITEVNKTENFSGFVVNEALVRMLGEEPDALIGKQLAINEGKAMVIGVVKDFHNNGLQESITPCVFLYFGNGFLDEVSIRLATQAADGPEGTRALEFIEVNWKALFPDDSFTFKFVKDDLEQHYMVENMVYKIFRIASGIAIFLGCLGLYGLVSFVAVQRTKEIGIRKVLGASLISILQLLSWDFIKLILLAVSVVTPLVWYLMQNWLQNFEYRISLEWWHFAGAGLLTMLIALCTVSFQAIKAAIANPVKSLRSE